MSAVDIAPSDQPHRGGRLAALGLALALVAGLLGLSATEAEPGEAQGRNLAVNAVPSASFTASHNNLLAVNDGEHSFSGPPETSYWGTWTASDRPASQFLQYDWAKPVQVDRTVVSFWTDAAPGTGNNVTVPESWSIDHWDQATEEWVPVTGASGFGTSRTETNETTFDPVTTTRLRATFSAYPNAAGTSYSALGVSEWEVWGGFAEAAPDTVIDVPVVHTRTTPGTAPTLPTSLDVVRLGGRVTPLDVEWEPVPGEDLATAGTVEVTGEVAGVAERATATVWVRDDPSSTIVTLEDAAVITTAGVRPVLPATVIATYDDGSRASDVEVTWPTPAPADYAEEGFFELTGELTGAGPTPRAWVFVQPDDGHTPAPWTTTTSAAPTTRTVPFGQAARLRVRVTAEDGAPDDSLPSGTVSVDGGGPGLGTATLVDGQATIALPDSLDVGTNRLTVSYEGTVEHASSDTTVDVRVLKVPSRLRAKVKPRRVSRDKRARVRFAITTATGVPATGTVVVKVLRGKQRLRTLRVPAGRGKVRLPALSRAGSYRVKVRYRGSAVVKGHRVALRLRVAR